MKRKKQDVETADAEPVVQFVNTSWAGWNVDSGALVPLKWDEGKNVATCRTCGQRIAQSVMAVTRYDVPGQG